MNIELDNVSKNFKNQTVLGHADIFLDRYAYTPSII